MTEKKINIGILGATGYTGVELLRLLVGHPHAQVSVVTSRTEAGTRVDALFPHLRGYIDLCFSAPDDPRLSTCDLVFFATPNGTAMQVAPQLLQAGVKLIDLSADFRLRDAAIWEKWYGMSHQCPELLTTAVYGLPEINRKAIAAARLVANPGCYPTAVQLGFLPLLAAGCVDPGSLIADAKSGVSGAGRAAKVDALLAETAENFKAYKVPGHRHLPEIEQGLRAVAGDDLRLVFVPHLLPMIRGIHATLYARLTQAVDLQALYEKYYAAEPFVDVLPPGSHPETRSVRGANFCRLAVHRPQQGDTAVVLAVEDNLVKGAAGQAVQNMNIMFGWNESTGLRQPPLSP